MLKNIRDFNQLREIYVTNQTLHFKISRILTIISSPKRPMMRSTAGALASSSSNAKQQRGTGCPNKHGNSVTNSRSSLL